MRLPREQCRALCRACDSGPSTYLSHGRPQTKAIPEEISEISLQRSSPDVGTWEGPDDQAGERLRAEHGIVSGWSGDELVLNAGSEGLLPPWPPVVNLPGLCVPIPSGGHEPERATCLGCGTRLASREGEWRHEVGLRERGGCIHPQVESS